MMTDPMTCDEALDLLDPYLDGELPPEEAGRLRAHLDRCPACATELALAGRIQQELRALPQPDCPPEVIQRVVWTGRGEIVPFPSPSRRMTRMRIAAAAAVLTLAVGGGSLFVHLQNQQNQQNQQRQPSPEQVAQATREARLALAYLGKVTRKAGLDVRDEVLEKRLVIPTARSVSRSLEEIPAAEPRKEL